MRDAIRALKGLYMFVMFAIFGAAIWLTVIFVIPLLIVTAKTKGPDPRRMQRLNRILFSFWLKLLCLGGLLFTKPLRDQLPAGTFVIVANHPGLFDILVLICEIPKLSVLVKGSLVRSLPLAPILDASAYLLVSEQGGFDGLETVRQGIEVIKRGYSLMLFPEGTRSPKNGLLRFRSGAFKISQRAGVPVLPILIRNTPPFLPHEDRWYFPLFELSRLELEVWDPIPPPPPGGERKAAIALEDRYRKALGLV